MIPVDDLPVIPFRPETDFEKLMFAYSYIRELKRLSLIDRKQITELIETIDALQQIIHKLTHK